MNPPVPRPAWRRARRLLALRLDNLGDLLMCTPALASLRAALPETDIRLLCSTAGASLLPHLPMIDGAKVFDAPWVRHVDLDTQRAHPGDAEHELLQWLRSEHFDAAVIFTTCTQSALPAAALLRLAGIPQVLAHSRENPYALLSDWVPEEDLPQGRFRHEVLRQLDLLRHIGVPSAQEHLQFKLDDQDRIRAHQRLSLAGVDPQAPFVMLHPGATAASRRWSPTAFGETARLLRESGDHQVVICGGAGDTPWVEEAHRASGVGTVAIAGIESLGELAAMISEAALLIANNSAPIHVAAATGTPVVCLYALTNPQHTPWRVPATVLYHDVPCRWCLKSTCPQGHHHCLSRIEPARVVRASRALLSQEPRRRVESSLG